ncbi:protein piccolo-like [Olea europaea var. sylvestris]|uniref:protein piccolo-like n=1 Tax=Olea europaea var. sylvestris TaxID=158386 RepID=UPI000C1D3E8B|nr:protein piccolo-like [Olea europaea var. sylvestris]
MVPNSYISFVGALPRCELSTEDFDTICVIYQLPQKKRSYHRLIRKNIHFITHDLMASQDNFNKKMLVGPDFKTIQKMMAEARALKASSSSYKKQTEDLVEASKRLQPPTEEEVPEDPEADLRRKGKKSATPPKRPTVARPPPALRQTTIPTGVAIPEKRLAPTELATAPATTSLTAVPIDQVPGQQKRKRPRPSKEVDFLGTNPEEPVREVLEALPPKTAMVAVVHNKYWTEEWRDHTASCTAEDLVAANSACVAQALSTSIQLEGLVKDLNSKREDLAKRLEEAMHYGDTVRAAQAKAMQAEEAKKKAEAQLTVAKAEVERLKKELYEVECQVAAVTQRLDHANEYHKLATEALEASNKEKAEAQ